MTLISQTNRIQLTSQSNTDFIKEGNEVSTEIETNHEYAQVYNFLKISTLLKISGICCFIVEHRPTWSTSVRVVDESLF